MENHKKRDYDYINQYNKIHCHRYNITINKEKNKDVIEYLSKQKSISATIVKAVRLLIESEENK